MIITSFSWRQRRYFYVLLKAGASFSISQVRVGKIFMSFTYQMCMDKEELVELVLLVKKCLCLYILCFMVRSVAPMYCLTELLLFTETLYSTFFCRQIPSRGHVFYPNSCIVC